MPLLEVNEVCTYASYHPINTTIIYPDNAAVKLINVHRTFCPCADGLMCGDSNTCYDPVLVDNLNSIDNSVYNHEQ